jgi:hypothetical protein
VGLYDRPYMRADRGGGNFNEDGPPRFRLAVWQRIVLVLLVLALIAGTVVSLF